MKSHVVKLQSQHWCFHPISSSFLETFWLFSSRALLRNAWVDLTFLKMYSFSFDSNRYLMRNKFNTPKYYSLCGWLRGIKQPLLTCVASYAYRELFFPFIWLSPSVKNFSEIPFSFCPQLLSFCRANWHTTVGRAILCPYSWANPAHPPFGCLQPGFCASCWLHEPPGLQCVPKPSLSICWLPWERCTRSWLWLSGTFYNKKVSVRDCLSLGVYYSCEMLCTSRWAVREEQST